jgi:uncharacterized protein YbbK (DUF523 family)
MVEAGWLEELQSKADVVPVCPEVLAGLDVPRLPINLYRKDGQVHVIQDETGLDVTEALERASDGFLSTLGDVDAFILKSKSPSCGLGTTKIREEVSFKLGSGVFAQKAMKKYGDVVFTDESELAKDGVNAFLERF